MKILDLFFILFFSICFSQENNIFERLSALNNNGKIWYNIDGYSVTSEKFKNTFDEKGLKKVFKKHQISESETKIKDDQISSNNLVVTKQQKISDDNFQINNYYFIENPDKTITVIWFIKNGKTDKETEEKLVNAIIENIIPNENFVPMQISSINFAGRRIELGNSCYWTFLNTVQCPYFGEMNWSVHKTLEDAKEAVDNQLKVTKSRKGGKVTSEEMVDIVFEGVPTKAKKVIYNFTGVPSALAAMSGGKSLTVYYVAENVRNKNVSAVMSFWNNDQINPETGLPPLLEKLIKLQ
ncbi:hypothetical protein [Chryseobacterium koreense]|uniref:Uncharacterized protein n=1 Tax=Chryseobacterium koreense CCUG 49689 TaxID=1304281 RepID=A0A0J7IXN6_9FLAO|nr:hypothetical protein [Chryseobacterium koreense]KMQ70757.1 hypothetical protein ACM44_10610 [Chryseobacterium koreense CCUG 49689]MBB5333652.1 hypothetical protein [Chryseobacterium koreense]